MWINPIFVSLSEGDKRMIFALILIFLLAAILIGYISYLIVKLMKWQGKKIDTLIHDVVVTRVIKDPQHLKSYGRKKNWAYFFKQAYIPLILLVIAAVFLIAYMSVTGNWGYNPFNVENGFGSIFWTFKLSNEYTEGTLIKFNRIIVDNTPHLSADGWGGYLFGIFFFVGGIWYVVVVMGLIGRTFKLIMRSKEVFEKSLDGFNQSKAMLDNTNPENKKVEETKI